MDAGCLETYCFSEGLLSYIEVFKGKRPYVLTIRGREIPVENWDDVVNILLVLIEKLSPGWLSNHAKQYGVVSLSELGFEAESFPYMFPRVKNAFRGLCKIRNMLSAAEVELSTLSVAYGERNGKRRTKLTRGVVCAEPVSEELRKAKQVLGKFFKSGIRANSVIDQNRFRRGFSEMHGESLRQDFDFAYELKKIGFEHEGKIFVQSETAGKECNEFIRGLISAGHRIFNFSRVMDLHASTLMPLGVSSAEMLEKFISPHAILSSIRNGVEDECWRPPGEAYYKIYRNWFVPVDGLFDLNAVVLNDIDEGALFVSEDDLCEKYPYVEPELVHRMLTSGLNYVWNEGRAYAISDRIAFDEKEVDCMRRIVVEAVRAEGYFSQAHIILPESAALNDGKLSGFALRKVFVEKFLSDEYERHGQIISKRGSNVDALIPLRVFCKQNSEVTMEQLENIMTEYNINDGYGLAKVKEMMVRIDVNRFVSPDLIEFDVKAIDQAMENLWFGSAMGIGAFVNFSGFPAVSGYAWTPYLLESFLQRESKSFCILNPRAGVEGAKRRIAGAVVRVSDGEKDAYEVFATAATESRIEPNPDAVGNFLFDNSFISNRSAKTVHKVIDLMQVIYEGKKHV